MAENKSKDPAKSSDDYIRSKAFIQKKWKAIQHEKGEQHGFGDELHLFLHCHLRGYDKHGNGEGNHAGYLDKYGAPVTLTDSWTEGYHEIEREMAKHFNQCMNETTGFPLVVGIGGGAHLYECYHSEKSHNWTGYVPRQNRWLSQASKNWVFYNNRYFMALRGNEIQNNLWNYHPQDEEEQVAHHGTDIPEILIYDQIAPKDKYKGGYWFRSDENRAWARYIHIMALKTHEENAGRYNFIVHPLAYRGELENLPDAAVDGIQWSIMNIAFEEHFNTKELNWGERCQGLELFNDFTYFYSWQPKNYDFCIGSGDKIQEIDTNNGRLYGTPENCQIVWFDTYPLEFAEFLIDNALARGVYLHALSANDAYYNRDIVPTKSELRQGPPLHADGHEDSDDDDMDVLLSDPKGGLIKRVKASSALEYLPRSANHRRQMQRCLTTVDEQKAQEFKSTLPYKEDTVFGYTTLIDTDSHVRKTVYPEPEKPWAQELEKGEIEMMRFLREGRFFSHTGVFNIFNYEESEQRIPFVIDGQTDQTMLQYEVKSAKNLKFTFQKCKPGVEHVIWRYFSEKTTGEENSKNRVTIHGYFKLSTKHKTVLDLSLGDLANDKLGQMKWVRFAAYDPRNPMKRAWFNPIRGPAFGEPIRDIHLPDPKHKIAVLEKGFFDNDQGGKVMYTEQAGKRFEPTTVPNDDKCFRFDFEKLKCEDEENHLYCYQMMSNSLTPSNLNTDNLKFSHMQPPRIRQNVHGYFPLSSLHPSRLEFRHSWDCSTTKQVCFYGIHKDTCEPFKIEPLPCALEIDE